jgi:CRISPR-associated exonuclease Cas4
MDSEDDLIPLSAIQHALYCPRQAGLIHLDRLWAENRFTAEGRLVHLRVDEAGGKRVRGVRRETSLAIASQRLGISGVADMVEFLQEGGRGELVLERPFPVEFKRGKPKAHRADEAQLCAQALCLEEMTGRPVPEGALYYAETKRRLIVTFDVELRALTEAAAAELRAMFASGRAPAAVYRAERCRACSLLDLCRPKALARSALGWRERAMARLLDERA